MIKGVGSNKNYERFWQSPDLPAPTILQSGALSNSGSGWILLDNTPPHLPMKDKTDKPEYKVPSMIDIAALPWNGYNVISTFSGAGGSCLGYKMAGYRVLWASEFIPAAQEVYKLNHPDSILDTRDIREVQPQDILDAIGMGVGEIDILDGSPPCASFSTAGKREAGWGEVKNYSDTKQRVDDLFYEYARIVNGIQPKVFIAENVSGLVKGTAKGYFKLILQELKDCGYTVSARLLDAQWLGVPQMRQRLIFCGVRNDLVKQYSIKPAHPSPLPYRYSVREALPWVVRGSIRDSGTLKRKWFYADRIQSPTVNAQQPYNPETSTQGMHIIEAETDISRYAIGDEWEKMGKLGQANSDKYLNLKRVRLDRPNYGISQMGGQSPGIASVTHPTEKRKFSIAELKRICAFPDDFRLTGTYAQQWERLGRAVPPVMMYHIAATVQTEILDKCKP